MFATKISPYTPAKQISLKQCEDILNAAKEILGQAIEEGGSTIKSYHPLNGVDGLMQVHLKAYGRQGQKCPVCGAAIQREALGGRSTYFCPACQNVKPANLQQKPRIIGITGPIHSGKSTVTDYYVKRGFKRFDADKEVRNLYRKKEVKAKAIKLIGKDAVKEGKMDFAYLRNAFALHPELKNKWENYLYPLVKKSAKELIAKYDKKTRFVLDVPLLIRAKMDTMCDEIIFVDAPIETRLTRFGDDEIAKAQLIKINAQYPLEETKEKATRVIVNDGDKAALLKKVKSLNLD